MEPPSTVTQMPVTNDARAETRKQTISAMSSGVAMRPSWYGASASACSSAAERPLAAACWAMSESQRSVRVAAGETGHRLDALPMGNGDELGLALAILAEELNAERLRLERPDALLVKISGIAVRNLATGNAAPDPRELRLHLS